MEFVKIIKEIDFINWKITKAKTDIRNYNKDMDLYNRVIIQLERSRQRPERQQTN